MDGLLKTPLFDAYREKAKIVDFAGWALPLYFEGIIPEHHAVRETAGLFDVTHMGEIVVSGKDAYEFLNKLLSNDLSTLTDYRVQYSLMLNRNGGTVDDVLVYRFSQDKYWVIVNAANRQKDYNWIREQAVGYEVSVNDLSDSIAQIALQGPKAADILNACGFDASEVRFFHFAENVRIHDRLCLISRSGYTGEDGFELYMEPMDAPAIWAYLLDIGSAFGLKPAGLGCRDTLRFEACLPLYGHELSEDITPFEAGLGRFVKLDKEDFIGKSALLEQIAGGLARKLTGFEMTDKGVPRSDYEVCKDGRQIGYVTTGYFSPTLKKNLGLALMDHDCTAPGTTIDVMIRGKALKAITVEIPFYTKKYKK
ncbi:MAG TPA: glycine cleavage system aminomethyltransferase GcvT [Candidatus Atribacteria bacterium]|nr:glycine cleavage system aminomethyltransferase GcvT [Candidatus Atribacteria bacterium]HPT77851.1 glycine cleavage system aminomethyltransferase GcvT [Candidatus Atribacteria bacterium]